VSNVGADEVVKRRQDLRLVFEIVSARLNPIIFEGVFIKPINGKVRSVRYQEQKDVYIVSRTETNLTLLNHLFKPWRISDARSMSRKCVNCGREKVQSLGNGINGMSSE
jgi:hypothetical protein